ncbi:MAG TPA: Crp/Fnr family transcriptional regulator [Spirochaetia bacterium]|nr:Crp/Fnr family transcriptional regulator [Spirochaetia bacterium]
MANYALHDQEKSILLAIGLPVQYRRGHVIFSAGEAADRIYLLEKGQVKIYRLTEDGDRATVALRYPGELIGLAEVLYGGQRTCFAQAMANVDLVMFKCADFLELLLNQPELNLKISRILGFRLREAQDTIYELACRYVPGRLALLLLKLAARCGIHETDGIRLDLPLTHEEIACMVGSSRPTITATLNDFQKEGAITWQGKYIKILQTDRLKSWI